MGSPYRSAAPREEGLRPLEPETEMRLLLERGGWPRGVQAVGLGVTSLVGIAALVAALFEPGILFHAAFYLAPGIAFLVSWLRYRRKIHALRAEGYDLEAVTEPRVRVAVESETRAAEPDVVDDDIEARRRAL